MLKITSSQQQQYTLYEALPSPLFDGGSDAGFFIGLDSVVVFSSTLLTPLPTTPRWVTPAASFVWAVETVGESKPPLPLVAAPICEELAAFSVLLAFAETSPRISERIDDGFDMHCCKSSSCKWKSHNYKRRNNQDINQNSFGDILAFFSNSADRPVSVSISASLADTESDCDALDDCLAIWSTLVADLSVDSDKSFISSVSLCSRDLQVETAFWQYGMASWGLEAISRHKHILKLL